MFLRLFFMSFFFISIRALENQRNLAILLDLPQQEHAGTGAIVQSLFYLLEAKNSPILIHSAVWENFKSYKKITPFGPLFIQEAVDREALLSDWQFYKKDDFLLLIPGSYMQEKNNKSGFDLTQLTLISPDNKPQDSFFFESKKTLSKVYYQTFPYGLEIKTKSFFDFLKIIVPADKTKDVLSWNIYLVGHGSTIYQTAGITETGFKNLLDFLENQINTHAFYYTSCFAAGKMADLLYEKRSFSYPIFTEGSDASTYATKSITFLFPLLEAVDTDRFETYRCLASNVSYWNHWNIYNLVSVRAPGKTEFQYIPVGGYVFPIHKNSTNKELLEIKAKPDNYILESSYAPVHININPDQSILSGIKGSSCQYVEKISFISSAHIKLGDPVIPMSFALSCSSCFKQASHFSAKKIFLCDAALEAVDTHDFTHVLIFLHDDIAYWPKIKLDLDPATVKGSLGNKMTLFFEHEERYYLFRYDADADYEMRHLSKEQAQKYLDFFNKNKDLARKEEQPIWKLDTLLQSLVVRKLFPAFVTASVCAALYLRLKIEMAQAERNRAQHEAHAQKMGEFITGMKQWLSSRFSKPEAGKA